MRAIYINVKPDMGMLEFIYEAIKSLNLTALLCVTVYFLWKMDRRLGAWDKNLSVKQAQCDGKFSALDKDVCAHSKKLVDHGRRINEVEDKILVIRNGAT